MTTTYKPGGYSSVSPYLITEHPEPVIDFLVSALGGKRLRRFDRPDGSIAHAEVEIDGSVVMLGGANESFAAVPCHIHVYVPDVEAAYERAVGFGCESVQEPKEQDGDPDRRCGVVGPGGNTWWIATQMPA